MFRPVDVQPRAWLDSSVVSYRRRWGQNIQAARLRRGLTQEKLARLLDCGQQNISRWERGVVVPRDGMKIRLAELLGIPVSELFPWDDADGGRAA